jgi:hypothetical protein
LLQLVFLVLEFSELEVLVEELLFCHHQGLL